MTSTATRRPTVLPVRLVALIGVFCLASIGIASLTTSTAANAATPPPTSKSYYISKYAPKWAYNEGCSLGRTDSKSKAAQTRVAILDFGMLKKSGTTWYFGTFGPARMSMSRAREMAYQYGLGYYNCTSMANLSSLIHVAIGTSNYGGQVNKAGGKQLAATAYSVEQRFRKLRYYQAVAAGASDFEAWGRNSAKAAQGQNAAARDFIAGYNAYPNYVRFFNYGSADGCNAGVKKCNPGLNAETIRQVSWKGRAYPIPEIYNDAMAQAWLNLSIYNYQQTKTIFYFYAMMTQRAACTTSSGTIKAECRYMKNTPSNGWNQLVTKLKSNKVTKYSFVGGPTDIRWQTS